MTFLKYKLPISYKFEQSYFELFVHNGTTDQIQWSKSWLLAQLRTKGFKNHVLNDLKAITSCKRNTQERIVLID